MPVTSTGQTQRVRIHAFDGLRGVAALMVVVHHTLLLTPALIAPYVEPRTANIPAAAWLITYTPLHILWDGPVAVFVFFVLSGFVLTIPFRHPPRYWLPYYPARLVRLYLPVWAAIGLAVVWALLIPHLHAGSSWVQNHHLATLGAVAHDVVLVVGEPGSTNTVLWSLRFEVLFSIGLPAFIAFALVWRRLIVLKLIVVCVLILLSARFGPVDIPTSLSYTFQLPIFALGCLLAVEWERVRTALERVVANDWRTAGIVVLALLGLTSYWIVCGFAHGTDPAWVLAASRLAQVLAAALTVALCGTVKSWGRLLGSSQMQWLGSRSFSLYLIHEPLVVAVGRLVPTSTWPIAELAITIPAGLLLSEAFFRIVERPSHHLSRAIATRLRPRQQEVVS